MLAWPRMAWRSTREPPRITKCDANVWRRVWKFTSKSRIFARFSAAQYRVELRQRAPHRAGGLAPAGVGTQRRELRQLVPLERSAQDGSQKAHSRLTVAGASKRRRADFVMSRFVRYSATRRVGPLGVR